MDKGRATGPQREPRRPAKDAVEVPDATQGGMGQQAYGRVRQRLLDEAERLAESVRDLPEDDRLHAGHEAPFLDLAAAEAKVSAIRVSIDQLRDRLP